MPDCRSQPGVRQAAEQSGGGLVTRSRTECFDERHFDESAQDKIAVFGTMAPMPLVAAYTASKTAIEGFTESLAFELEAFNVRVKLVEPGYGPTTRFAANGGERMQGLIPEPYAPFAQSIFAMFGNPAKVTTEADVADAVWRAANDTTGTLRYPAGEDAIALSRKK